MKSLLKNSKRSQTINN